MNLQLFLKLQKEVEKFEHEDTYDDNYARELLKAFAGGFHIPHLETQEDDDTSEIKN